VDESALEKILSESVLEPLTPLKPKKVEISH